MLQQQERGTRPTPFPLSELGKFSDCLLFTGERENYWRICQKYLNSLSEVVEIRSKNIEKAKKNLSFLCFRFAAGASSKLGWGWDLLESAVSLFVPRVCVENRCSSARHCPVVAPEKVPS
ncbi:hypothetical protein KY290_008733 [Solanum tuberosum]|uniref:Uncharacterized protein n=1 Tax=Solanum tuberosum TaxID=4113 RepID=A0ABQ7W995_SOLTU|nr:hypothetical protein KY290_008733 [Solanum tuberosum]